MIVEVGGVFYKNVISITEVAPNKATLVMSVADTGVSADAQSNTSRNKSLTVPIYCPIQIIGTADETETLHSGAEGKKAEKPLIDRFKDRLKGLKFFFTGLFLKVRSQAQG